MRCYLTVCLILFTCILSCAANLEVLKNQEEASRNLGEIYLRQKNYTLALREFLKAEKLYDKDPFLQNDLGLVYLAKDRFDLAIDHFNKALDIKPDYAPARNNLGTAYMSKKDWDTAIACFKELTGNLLYATPHYPLSNLGWAYYNKKKYGLAEKYYKEALKIQPKFIVALIGLGRTYMAVGKSADAIEVFERTVKYFPATAEVYFDLAGAYKLSHDYNKALNAYNKVVDLVPETPLADKAAKEAGKMKNLLFY